MEVRPEDPRCAALSAAAGEPMAGSAPRADLWVVVEHPDGWGDAALARSGHGVRVVLARGSRQACAEVRAAGRSRVWVASTAEPQLRVGMVGDPHEVARWDLAALADGGWRGWGRIDPEPLLLVCANGRRDRCCGHAGGRLAEQLWADADDGRVLTSTHLGGHRFAPTALLLPWGVLHGRLDRLAVAAIRSGAAGGMTPTATLRGHSALDAPRQVAEAHARGVLGHTGLAPLPVTLVGEPAAGRVRAEVGTPEGGVLAVALAREAATGVASCGRAPEPLERWVVVG
jgi:hypothetical protein